MSTTAQFSDEAGHLPSDWDMRLLNDLAIGRIENFSTINRIDTPELRQAFGNKAKQFTCNVVFVILARPRAQPNEAIGELGN
jgi:hypothetical protein